MFLDTSAVGFKQYKGIMCAAQAEPSGFESSVCAAVRHRLRSAQYKLYSNFFNLSSLK